MKPYGIYVERAKGARKWDVDGSEYVDYFGGHGALLLGHNHPSVVAASHAALDQGTHFGANHPREVRWAELVRKLVPSAESVRFTSSGTEATLMAVRLSRSVTGKPKVVRFLTHFHGWHDHMTSGHASHFDGTPTAGVLAGVAEHVILLPPGDVEAVKRTFASRNDIACVILEPTGTSFGAAPLPPSFLHLLREGQTWQFPDLRRGGDGFRVSPGGAQGSSASRPTSRRSPRSWRADCPAARSLAGATSWTISTSTRPSARSARRLRIPAPTMPIRSRPPPASPRWRSSALASPASRQAPRRPRSARRSTRCWQRSACPGRCTAPSAASTSSSIRSNGRSIPTASTR
jgi:hypothetical protein